MRFLDNETDLRDGYRYNHADLTAPFPEKKFRITKYQPTDDDGLPASECCANIGEVGPTLK